MINRVIGASSTGYHPQRVNARATERTRSGPGWSGSREGARGAELMAIGLITAGSRRSSGSSTTVRGHVRSVIEKLGARSRLEAVARAYQMGLVPT